ncbi:carbohydrate kinase family protein [Rhizobium hainanense]|uniref:Ribokinase n=1 Tax=Rhizobium hainanense TaxID=52131 RepID=A0A1C3WGK9_9HYPH|nr:carbohydrate kinase family protein [Rhizobium hainanense]SCB39141.1 ribokinase [Rhizobium hainanense]
MRETSILSPGSINRRYDLLAYGDPNVDYVFETARVPLADEKVLGRNLGIFAGGTVANVACAASRLGARVVSYGRVGNDIDGQLLLRDNESFGVANDYLTIAAHRTAAAMIMVEASGEKALVYAPMPSDPLAEDRLGQALAESRIAYAMPYDIDEFRRVSALARKYGTDVAIDIEAAVAPTVERLDALLTCSDIVFMNEGGFRATCERPITPENIRPLLERGPRIVVVTMGAKGAIAVGRDCVASQDAFIAQVVDATGAGDCFNGAFLAAALADRPTADCLSFASAAASLAVSAMGARSALPDVGEVSRLLDTARNCRH